MQIRQQTDADLPRVLNLIRAAFMEEGESVARLVPALQASSAYAGQSWVAVDDERLIGQVMLTRGWLDADQALVEAQVLSPLAVTPDRQREGIGRALVAHALDQAERMGAIGVFLEGDPAYYSRLGFTPAEDDWIMRASLGTPGPAFQWVRLSAYEPWMRGRLVYPDAFWEHDAVGLRDWRRKRHTPCEYTTTTLGARDPRTLAEFYAALLGWRIGEGDGDWIPVRDPDGGRGLAIQLEPDQVPAAWPAGPGDQHMQMHLEIRVDDLDRGVAHALKCGARLADSQPQDDVRVCFDPEGHPLCLWLED